MIRAISIGCIHFSLQTALKDDKVLSILKQHPQLLAAFIKQRQQAQQQQQQQQQHQQQQQQQQNIFQQLPPVSQMNAMSLKEKPPEVQNQMTNSQAAMMHPHNDQYFNCCFVFQFR